MSLENFNTQNEEIVETEQSSEEEIEELLTKAKKGLATVHEIDLLVKMGKITDEEFGKMLDQQAYLTTAESGENMRKTNEKGDYEESTIIAEALRNRKPGNEELN